MNFSLLELITYFILYSFLGWVLESIYRSICERKIINTGFLIGPCCPIYGIGAIIMFLFLDTFKENPVILFFIAMFILTLWEYIVGVLLEKIFHTKYWDYSNQRFNFQGRICLTNSIFWGILGVVFVKYIHPWIQTLVEKINIDMLTYIVTIAGMVIIIDLIVSIIKVKNIKSTLQKIEEINKEIKEKLKQLKELTKEKEEHTQITQTVQKMVDKLKKRRNRMFLHLYKNVYRLKKAFPAINTKEITEILNKKIEIIKEKNNPKKK